MAYWFLEYSSSSSFFFLFFSKLAHTNVVLLDGHVPILKVDGSHVSLSSEVFKRQMNEGMA